MEEESNKGVWIGLVVVALIAVVFGILWFMRGGDVDKLTADLGASRTALQRTERELGDVKSQVESSAKRIGELENQAKDHAKRAAENAASLERSLRSELDFSAQRLSAANAELDRLRSTAGAAATPDTEKIEAELKKARIDLASVKNAGAEEITRLTAELETAKKQAGELEAKVAEGSAAIAKLETDIRQARPALRAETGDAVSAAAVELTALKAELAKTAQQLAETKNANAVLEELRTKLAAAMESDKSAAAAREEELRRAIEDMRKQLQASAAPSSPAPAAAAPSQSEAQLRAEVERVRKELADFKAKADNDAQTVDAEWKKRIAAADAGLSAIRGQLEADAKAADDAARQRIAALEAELESVKTGHADSAKAADSAWQDKLTAAEKNFAAKAEASDKLAAAKLAAALKQADEKIAVLQREMETRVAAALKQGEEKAASERKAADDKAASIEKLWGDKLTQAQASEKDAISRLALLQTAYIKQNEKLKTIDSQCQKEIGELRKQIEKLEKQLAEYGPGGSKFAIGPSGRSVGKVVDRIGDGTIMLIDKGAKDGVRAGMKFDVYRPLGEGNRYVGMIKIIRAEPESAMAVSSYAEVNGLVCPKTGRAVLEPGAKFSPFAVGDDGKPLPLVKADEVRVPLEAPAIGDLLDNPFYDPAKPLSFVLPESMLGDDCVYQALRAVNGALGKDDSADFALVDGASPVVVGGPRRVTLEHMERYMDRAWRF